MSQHGCAQPFWQTYSGSACSRDGVVEEDGDWWCRQHAPSAVKARRAASIERGKAKLAASLPARYAALEAAARAVLLGDYTCSHCYPSSHHDGAYCPVAALEALLEAR